MQDVPVDTIATRPHVRQQQQPTSNNSVNHTRLKPTVQGVALQQGTFKTPGAAGIATPQHPDHRPRLCANDHNMALCHASPLHLRLLA